MWEKPEQLSPEEKLLRVIQGDKPASPESAQEEPETVFEAPEEHTLATVAAAPVPAADSPKDDEPRAESPVEERPKLKLAEEEKTPAAATVAASGAAAAPAKAVKRGRKGKAKATAAVPAEEKEPAPLISRKAGRPEGMELGIGTLNRCLVAVAIVMLCFTAIEIWANVRGDAGVAIRSAADLALPVASVAAGSMPPIDAVLKSLASRPLFPVPFQPPPPNSSPPPPPPQENLVLLGMSRLPGSVDGMEAIIVDKVANKMHFLRIGQVLSVGQKDLKLEAIAKDHIIFSDGSEQVIVR